MCLKDLKYGPERQQVFKMVFQLRTSAKVWGSVFGFGTYYSVSSAKIVLSDKISQEIA